MSNRVDGVYELKPGIFFKQVSFSPCGQCKAEVLPFLVHAEKKNFNFGILSFDFPGCLDPPEFWHGDIQNHHIRGNGLQQLDQSSVGLINTVQLSILLSLFH